jgi:hypothetical protein
MENTSGQGKQAVLPAELAGWSWNWGAFLWTFIWGLFNKTYIALLIFVPLVNIFMLFILGFKGNAWAWRNKKWESLEHFRRVQRKWSIWGFIILLVSLLATAGGIFYSFEEVKNSEPYVGALNAVRINKDAQKLLGSPIEPGWWFTGSFSSKGETGQAELVIPVKGPSQEGMVHIRAIQDKQQWKVAQAVLVPASGGAPIDLFPARQAPAVAASAVAPVALSKDAPPPAARAAAAPLRKSAAPAGRAVRKAPPEAAVEAKGLSGDDHEGYVIHLKTGGRFLTPKYWEENQEIKFYIAGGVMGVENRSVSKIEKIEGGLRREAFVPPAPSARPPPEAPAKKEDAAAPPEKVDIQAYKGRKDQMTVELDQISERLREATRRQDQAAKTRVLEEMRNKSAQIYDLTDEVTQKNKGKLPDGWWNRP